MNNTKFTKGEWFSSYTEVISMPTQTKIGNISGNSYEEAKANALLISKSPEMLEMLKELKDRLEYYNDTVSVNEIEQLIKEATDINKN
jgi:hypothetical protein